MPNQFGASSRPCAPSVVRRSRGHAGFAHRKKEDAPASRIAPEAPALHATQPGPLHEPGDGPLRTPHAPCSQLALHPWSHVGLPRTRVRLAQPFGDSGILAPPRNRRGIAPPALAAARHAKRPAYYGDGVSPSHRFHTHVTFGRGSAKMPKAFFNVPLRPQALDFAQQQLPSAASALRGGAGVR